jgi:hypothetical protein
MAAPASSPSASLFAQSRDSGIRAAIRPSHRAPRMLMVHHARTPYSPPLLSPPSQSSSLSMPPTHAPLAPRDDNDGDKSSVALVVCLCLLAVALLGGVAWFTVRMRKRARAGLTGFTNLDSDARDVGPRHLASRITPFGTRDRTPLLHSIPAFIPLLTTVIHRFAL